MTEVFNMANLVSDESAVYLVSDENFRTDINERHLDMYISHNDVLFAFGYVNDALVWLSTTNLSDSFLSRRVFECVRCGSFYRRVEFSTALDTMNLTRTDLQAMCYVRLDGITADEPVFTGCIVGSYTSGRMSGIDFADIIAVMPKRLRQSIVNIGTEDEILTELEKDQQCLDAIYNRGIALDKDSCDKIYSICDKWREAECLKFCSRASVRMLYRNVRYFADNNNVKIKENIEQSE